MSVNFKLGDRVEIKISSEKDEIFGIAQSQYRDNKMKIYEERMLMIKRLISELSETQQLNVNDLVNFLRENSSKNPVETLIAMSLISCELELNQL